MRFFNLLLSVALLIPFFVYSQAEDEWQCGVSLDTSFYQPTESIIPIVDDTLKVGLLLVQFADLQDSLDSRGGVGWSNMIMQYCVTV